MSQVAHSLSDSYESDSNNEPLFDHISTQSNVNPAAPCSLSKRKNALIKVKANREKMLEKKEKFKHISPATCLNYILMFVDRSLSNNKYFYEIITELEKGKVPVVSHGNQTNGITWKRKGISGDYNEEAHLLVLWDHITLLHHIEKFHVIETFENLKKNKPGYAVYLVVYGLRDYCRRLRKKSKLTAEELSIGIAPSREIVEQVLTEAQLLMSISYRLFDDKLELVSFINHLTKSIAEEPYKKEKEKIELEKTSYLQGCSRSCVKIDKYNNGMLRLWQQQLAQLPMSSLDYGKAITSVYPSPYALYHEYSAIAHKEERENLLQNISIGRDGSKKRLGPEMSKKICHMFSSQDAFI